MIIFDLLFDAAMTIDLGPYPRQPAPQAVNLLGVNLRDIMRV